MLAGEEEAAARLLRLWGKDDGADEEEAVDAEDGCWCMGRMLVGLWCWSWGGGAAWESLNGRAISEGNLLGVTTMTGSLLSRGGEHIRRERREMNGNRGVA